jgi:hypothetical protein
MIVFLILLLILQIYLIYAGIKNKDYIFILINMASAIYNIFIMYQYFL